MPIPTDIVKHLAHMFNNCIYYQAKLARAMTCQENSYWIGPLSINFTLYTGSVISTLYNRLCGEPSYMVEM